MASKFIPYWVRGFTEEVQENILEIIVRCNVIKYLLKGNGDDRAADLEGARVDLVDTLTEIFEKKKDDITSENPLWVAIMRIRPQVIGGWMPTIVTDELTQALWTIKGNAQEKEVDKAAFFGKLAGRLRRHQISFFRAVIYGGPLEAKEKGEWKTHYFPGIAITARAPAGVKLSTSPENVEPVLKAYQTMAGKTTGHAKTVIEAVIEDIKELSENLYPPGVIKK